MNTTTFDMKAVEERADEYLAEYPSMYGSYESNRVWLLVAKLLDARGATAEEKDWALKAIVAAKHAEYWRGWHNGLDKGAST